MTISWSSLAVKAELSKASIRPLPGPSDASPGRVKQGELASNLPHMCLSEVWARSSYAPGLSASVQERAGALPQTKAACKGSVDMVAWVACNPTVPKSLGCPQGLGVGLGSDQSIFSSSVICDDGEEQLSPLS